LEEEIYLLQPEGFEVGGPDCICKLYKSLSLRSQASRRSLEQDIAFHPLSIGFCRIQSDVYMYLKNELQVIVPVFVDDIIFASKGVSKLNSIIQRLGQHFKLHDLGPTTQLLGILIHRDPL
jgi:hypothetical protein